MRAMLSRAALGPPYGTVVSRLDTHDAVRSQDRRESRRYGRDVFAGHNLRILALGAMRALPGAAPEPVEQRESRKSQPDERRGNERQHEGEKRET